MGHKYAMNQLKMSQQQSIITLWQHGWSFRRIARELQLRRETVSKYVRQHEAEVSKPAKVLTGSTAAAEPKADIPLTGSEPVPEQNRPFRSPGVWRLAGRVCVSRGGRSLSRRCRRVCPPSGFIRTWWADISLTGSYDAVKRFVRQLRQTQPVPFVRMEVEPGLEAQVDFGLGAWVLVEGKRKRPHLFRMVLSHSRKGLQ